VVAERIGVELEPVGGNLELELAIRSGVELLAEGIGR